MSGKQVCSTSGRSAPMLLLRKHYLLAWPWEGSCLGCSCLDSGTGWASGHPATCRSCWAELALLPMWPALQWTSLWEAGTFSLCGCFKAGLDKQQTMLRTCSDGQDGKGAWSILVNTYVPVKSRLLWWISSHVTFVSLVSAQLLHILPFPNILHSFTSQP